MSFLLFITWCLSVFGLGSVGWKPVCNPCTTVTAKWQINMGCNPNKRLDSFLDGLLKLCPDAVFILRECAELLMLHDEAEDPGRALSDR